MDLFSRRHLVTFIFAGVAVLLLGGCSTSSYRVKVDAINKGDATTGAGVAGKDLQSYQLKTISSAHTEESLRHKEAAEFVRTALSSKGLYEAPAPDKADMVVEMDYGLDAPRTKMEMVSVPVYAQTGGGVRYEQVPTVDARGNHGLRTVAVYQVPRSELIGFDEVPRMVTIYEKYLRVTARENTAGREGRPPAEVWSVSVSAEDESKDLRKYLPILASATADYIGKDSNHNQVVKIKDPSQLTEFIRRGMGDPAEAKSAAVPKP